MSYGAGGIGSGPLLNKLIVLPGMLPMLRGPRVKLPADPQIVVVQDTMIVMFAFTAVRVP